MNQSSKSGDLEKQIQSLEKSKKLHEKACDETRAIFAELRRQQLQLRKRKKET